MKNRLFLLLFSTLIINGCENSQKEKELNLREREVTLKEKELALKSHSTNKQLTTNDAVRIAERKFNAYLPKILESHDAILDLQQSYTGDFTGDGIEDVAIYYSLAPSGGGNAIVGQGLSLYENKGNDVKVIAGYEPDYLFGFDRISNGRIYVEKLEYAENDGRCCPSIKTEHTLTISGSKAY